MSMSPFVGDGSGTHQFRIELAIAHRDWTHDLTGLKTLHDIDRGGFAGGIFKNEPGWLRVGSRRRHGESRSRGREEGGAAEKEKDYVGGFLHLGVPSIMQFAGLTSG